MSSFYKDTSLSGLMLTLMTSFNLIASLETPKSPTTVHSELLEGGWGLAFSLCICRAGVGGIQAQAYSLASCTFGRSPWGEREVGWMVFWPSPLAEE